MAWLGSVQPSTLREELSSAGTWLRADSARSDQTVDSLTLLLLRLLLLHLVSWISFLSPCSQQDAETFSSDSTALAPEPVKTTIVLPRGGLCRNWEMTGSCVFKQDCRFTHGVEGEPNLSHLSFFLCLFAKLIVASLLRPSSSERERIVEIAADHRQLCKDFLTKGCRRDNCRFRHSGAFYSPSKMRFAQARVEPRSLTSSSSFRFLSIPCS